jgi:hypothetical protein
VKQSCKSECFYGIPKDMAGQHFAQLSADGALARGLDGMLAVADGGNGSGQLALQTQSWGVPKNTANTFQSVSALSFGLFVCLFL